MTKKLDKTIVISLYNNKGGVGKTQIAINLSSQLSNDFKTLLVDNDRQANATGILFGEFFEEQNILSLYQGREFTIQRAFGGEGLGKELYVLPGCPDIEESKNFIESKTNSQKILKKQLEKVKNAFDFIIIDNPPSIDTFSYNGLYASDYVIIPFKPGAPEFQGMANLRRIITNMQEEGEKIDLLGVLINMYNERTKATQRYVSQLFKIMPESQIFDVVIPLSQDFMNAFMDGLPIDFAHAKQETKDSFIALKEEMLAKLKIPYKVKKGE